MIIFMALILALLTSSTESLSMDFTEVKSVKYKGTTKDATCDITVEYSGSDVDDSGSSVSCNINWPTNKDLDKDISFNVIVGDVLGDLLKVTASLNLNKKKNKPASKTKVSDLSFSAETYTVEDASSYPADLWCPAEDKIIFGDNGGVVNETMEEDWQGCAYQCATYTNSAGNAPCFSWTFNNADIQMFGLQPGVCRLLGHMNVMRMPAEGVQSGYHKCWKAYSTSARP